MTDNRRSGARGAVAIWLLLILLGILLVAAGVWLRGRPQAIRLAAGYHAVQLTNGQVYFGKLEGLGTEFPILSDAFSVQTTTSQETKQVTSILVRRAKEWHGPDRIILNAEHIVMIEPVGGDSRVSQLIREADRK
jgi:hypothetical protein